jgi:hypothetical protein
MCVPPCTNKFLFVPHLSVCLFLGAVEPYLGVRIRIQEAQKYTYGSDGSGFAFIFLPFLGAIEPVAGSVRPATSGGGLLPGGRGGPGTA